MSDAFYRLLEELARNAMPLGGGGKRSSSKRAPREFPPVGMVPVRDSGDSIVRDRFGAPVKALGRVREETYVVPSSARGIDLGDGSSAYKREPVVDARRKPASDVEVRPFVPDALPDGVALEDVIRSMIGPDSTPAASSNRPPIGGWEAVGTPREDAAAWDGASDGKLRLRLGNIDVAGRGTPEDAQIDDAAISAAAKALADKFAPQHPSYNVPDGSDAEHEMLRRSRGYEEMVLRLMGLLN